MANLLGRKASPCRRCGGLAHYVNRMGGATCSTCTPPTSASDLASAMTIEGGVWIDPANRFDMVPAGGQAAGQSPAAASAPRPTSVPRPDSRPAPANAANAKPAAFPAVEQFLPVGIENLAFDPATWLQSGEWIILINGRPKADFDRAEAERIQRRRAERAAKESQMTAEQAVAR